MRFIFPLLLLVLPSFAFSESSFSTGEEAPLFNLQSLKLESFRGRKVILHFWSPSCFVCPDEVKLLDRWQARFGNDVTQVITVVSFDNSKKSLSSIERMKLAIPVVNDLDDSIASLYGVNSLPVSFLIDEKGKFVEIDDPEKPSKKAFKLIGQRDWLSEGAIASLLKAGFIEVKSN